MTGLERLDHEIFSCHRCDDEGYQVRHPKKPLTRGAGRLMVVGIGPGKVESQSGKPFSGPAGKRLMSWLIRAGIGRDEDAVRKKCYLTSIIKCGTANTPPTRVIHNCAYFLERQLSGVQPQILMPLGMSPLQALFGTQGKLEDFVGKHFTEDNFEASLLLRRLGPSCIIAPFPHPSGLSRWLNEHADLLELAISQLRGAAIRLGIGDV